MLAEFIKEARESRGLTQKEVSDHFGYSSCQFVSNWERGVSKPPLASCKRLCELLRIPRTQFRKVLVEQYSVEVTDALGLK